jgi:hypothetical protein
LAHRAPKTVNNVLTVLSTLLKKALEWGELDRFLNGATLICTRAGSPSSGQIGAVT